MTKQAPNTTGLHDRKTRCAANVLHSKALRRAGSKSEVRCAVHCTTGAGRDDARMARGTQARSRDGAGEREGGGSRAARARAANVRSVRESFGPFESSKPIRVGDVVRMPDGELYRCIAVSRHGRGPLLISEKPRIVCLNPQWCARLTIPVSEPGAEKRRTRTTPPSSTPVAEGCRRSGSPLPVRQNTHGKPTPGFGGEMPHMRREVGS